MPGSASLPRRSKVLFSLVLAAIVALIAFGPLREATWIECAFSSTLILAFIVLLVLLTRRWMFALALPTLVFGGLLIASIMKFHYLTTPLMAPDLVYFVNRDLFDVALHYPPILIAVVAGTTKAALPNGESRP